jgi:hypothetical protein
MTLAKSDTSTGFTYYNVCGWVEVDGLPAGMEVVRYGGLRVAAGIPVFYGESSGVERQGPSKISSSGTITSPQPQVGDACPSPGLQEALDPLPKSYGRTTVVLMAVNPYLVHAYWEVTPKDLEDARGLWGPQVVQPALRLYDVTGISFDGTNTRCCFDVDVHLAAENWYVHLWSPAKSYVADLGLRTADGSFFALVRSNIAHTPPAEPSMKVNVQYLPVHVGSEVQTTGTRFVDLTQMNENSFISGMSSR